MKEEQHILEMQKTKKVFGRNRDELHKAIFDGTLTVDKDAIKRMEHRNQLKKMEKER